MAARRNTNPEPERPRRPPATTPEGRENQLIAAAWDLAEQQLLDGTASAQVISSFLKLGSSREKLEQERLRIENDYTKSKIDAIAAAGRMENLFAKAMDAFRGYSGETEVTDGGEYED